MKHQCSPYLRRHAHPERAASSLFDMRVHTAWDSTAQLPAGSRIVWDFCCVGLVLGSKHGRGRVCDLSSLLDTFEICVYRVAHSDFWHRDVCGALSLEDESRAGSGSDRNRGGWNGRDRDRGRSSYSLVCVSERAVVV